MPTRLDRWLADALVRAGKIRSEDAQGLLAETDAARAQNPKANLATLAVQRKILQPSEAAQLIHRVLEQHPEQALDLPGYEIQQRIARGAMGQIFRARQKSMDRTVAIKILAPHLAGDPSFVQRFLREARAMARLNHPNIVAGIDAGEHNGIYYFVMEYVDGQPVSDLAPAGKPLDERRVLQIGRDVARALEHASRHGVVHRDIKPENIMITRDGVVKLCDLGLAKQIHIDPTVTMEGTTVGTPYYVSPEQARGEKNLDVRSDIYSLGATMYRLATGTVPFPGDDPMVVMTKHVTEPLQAPSRRNPALSAEFDRLIARMMAKKPEDRFASAGDLAAEIERLLAAPRPQRTAARPTRGPATGLRSPTTRRSSGVLRATPPRRRSLLPLALAATAAAAAGIAIWAFTRAAENAPPPAPASEDTPAPTSRGHSPETPPPADPVERFRTMAAAVLESPSLEGLEDAWAFVQRMRTATPDASRWEEALRWFRAALDERIAAIGFDAAREAALAAETEGRLYDAEHAFDEFPGRLRRIGRDGPLTAAGEFIQMFLARVRSARMEELRALRARVQTARAERNAPDALRASGEFARLLPPDEAEAEAARIRRLAADILRERAITPPATSLPEIAGRRAALEGIEAEWGSLPEVAEGIAAARTELDRQEAALRAAAPARAAELARTVAARIESALRARDHAAAAAALQDFLRRPDLAMEREAAVPPDTGVETLLAALAGETSRLEDAARAAESTARAVESSADTAAIGPMYRAARALFLVRRIFAEAEAALPEVSTFRWTDPPRGRNARVRLVEELGARFLEFECEIAQETVFERRAWVPKGDATVPIEDIVALARRRSRDWPAFHAAAGLALFYEGEAHHSAAKAELLQAVERDPSEAEWLAPYLDQLEGVATPAEEQEAERLLRDARSYGRGRIDRNRQRAAEIARDLLRRLAHTRVVSENRQEIEELAAFTPPDARPPSDPAETLFAVRPARQGNLWVWTYTFAEDAETREFEGRNLQRVDRGLAVDGRGALLWRGVLSGNALMEIELTPDADGNFGLLLHSSDEQDIRAGEGYVGFFRAAWGGARAVIPPNLILRRPFAAGRRIVESFVAQNGAEPPIEAGTPVTVAMAYRGGLLELSAGGRVMATGRNTAYTRGRPGFVTNGTNVVIHRVRIAGTLDPEWVRAQSQDSGAQDDRQ